ncbi:MAG: Gfo/Idh/MocA family oxidoreductase [Bryobacteraceae bacterium]|nr:Gfo/Idh/MocA family oxidoreductase [Bryobacteraceae bacterium]
MSQAIRLGIIGCGKVAWERHHPALRTLPEFEIRCVADPNGDRAAHIARLFGGVETHADYRELVARNDLDAVAVLTQTGAHAVAGCAVLDAGKHLFLEKPLALTLEEGDRLIEARKRSGKKAQVCFNLRWHRLIIQARSIIASGALGHIKAIHSVYTHNRTGQDAPDWHRKLSLGGGVGFNEGVHHYDLWRYLTGREVTEIRSINMPSEVYEDETAVISARLDGGILASGVFSFLTGPNSQVEVFGEHGRLLISLYRFDGLQFYPTGAYPGAVADRVKRGARSLLSLPGLVHDARNGGAFQATFAACWRSFGESVRSGSPPICTLEDGRHALQIALAAESSDRSKLPAPLEAAGDPTT